MKCLFKLMIKGVGIWFILLMLYFVINLFINFNVFQISNLFGVRLTIDVSKGRVVTMSSVAPNFYISLLLFTLFYGGIAFWINKRQKQIMKQDRLIDWAKRLQSLAQAGLTYGKDNFDLERYQEIRDISAEMMAEKSGLPIEKVKELFCNEVGYQTPKLGTRAAIFKDDKKFCSFRKMMVLGQSQVVGVK